jgi:hypothetical protein
VVSILQVNILKSMPLCLPFCVNGIRGFFSLGVPAEIERVIDPRIPPR